MKSNINYVQQLTTLQTKEESKSRRALVARQPGTPVSQRTVHPRHDSHCCLQLQRSTVSQS